MEFVELNTESLPHRQRDLGEQRRPVGVKKPVQSAPQPVVAQVRHLLCVDPEHPCSELVNGFMLAINRFPLHDD